MDDELPITNEELRESIMNINELMNKINNTVHSYYEGREEHLLTEADEHSSIEELKQKLGKIKRQKAHHKNKLSTVVQESQTNSECTSKITETPRDPESIDITQNIPEYPENKTLQPPSSLPSHSNFSFLKQNRREKNLAEHLPTNEQSQNTEGSTNQNGKMVKYKKIQLTKGSGKVKKQIGLKQLVAKRQVSIDRCSQKKGLSLYSRTKSKQKSMLKSIENRPEPVIKPEKKIVSIDLRKGHEVAQPQKIKKIQSIKLSLQNFYNSKRISK